MNKIQPFAPQNQSNTNIPSLTVDGGVDGELVMSSVVVGQVLMSDVNVSPPILWCPCRVEWREVGCGG